MDPNGGEGAIGQVAATTLYLLSDSSYKGTFASLLHLSIWMLSPFLLCLNIDVAPLSAICLSRCLINDELRGMEALNFIFMRNMEA